VNIEKIQQKRKGMGKDERLRLTKKPVSDAMREKEERAS